MGLKLKGAYLLSLVEFCELHYATMVCTAVSVPTMWEVKAHKVYWFQRIRSKEVLLF